MLIVLCCGTLQAVCLHQVLGLCISKLQPLVVTQARSKLKSVILQRWAVYTAANMLTKYDKEYQALQQAMQQRASIDRCVAAIEQS